jgi:polyisoprenoid-binding protein YceI
MKTLFVRNSALVLSSLLLGLSASAQSLSVYRAEAAGSSVKIDGSSTIHDWSIDGKIIGGRFEIDPAFPIMGTPAPGKVNAKAKATIPVRSLKSGTVRMDEVMQEHMKATEFPKIDYELSEMTLKEAPKTAADPLVFDTAGKLTISGVTKDASMVVTCDRSVASKLKFKGVANLKMTDFGIKPPAPSLALGLIKTGDDVKITIEWVTSQKPEAAGK